MRSSVLGLAAAFGLLAAAAPAAAQPPAGKTVRCVLTGSDGRYDGPCRQIRETGDALLGGSFSLQPVGKRTFFGVQDGAGVTDVSVSITKPGEAEVSGTSTSGVGSRWGTAKRVKSQPACWAGDDFRICSYAASAK